MSHALTLLERLHALDITIDRVTTSQLRLPGGMGRVTTIVELHGLGHVGRGEDIAYSSDTQELLPAAFAQLDIAGTTTVGALATKLDATTLDLPATPSWDDKPGYHRWALESAVIDLALRQGGRNMSDLVDELAWHPVSVSLSMGLGEPPTADVVHEWLDRDPSITFKLDTNRAWSADLVRDLAATGAVTTVDFKGLYHGDWVDNDPDPELYAAVGEGLPDAYLEDTDLTDAHRAALSDAALNRLAWDFPITGPSDVPGLDGSTATFSDLRPHAINIKPSRFGSIDRVLRTIDLCERAGIPLYAGGQFELGIGRTQVQAIASLFFAAAPNDCAPAAFHGATPSSDVPLGPVVIPAGIGFGWDAPSPATSI